MYELPKLVMSPSSWETVLPKVSEASNDVQMKNRQILDIIDGIPRKTTKTMDSDDVRMSPGSLESRLMAPDSPFSSPEFGAMDDVTMFPNNLESRFMDSWCRPTSPSLPGFGVQRLYWDCHSDFGVGRCEGFLGFVDEYQKTNDYPPTGPCNLQLVKSEQLNKTNLALESEDGGFNVLQDSIKLLAYKVGINNQNDQQIVANPQIDNDETDGFQQSSDGSSDALDKQYLTNIALQKTFIVVGTEDSAKVFLVELAKDQQHQISEQNPKNRLKKFTDHVIQENECSFRSTETIEITDSLNISSTSSKKKNNEDGISLELTDARGISRMRNDFRKYSESSFFELCPQPDLAQLNSDETGLDSLKTSHSVDDLHAEHFKRTLETKNPTMNEQWIQKHFIIVGDKVFFKEVLEDEHPGILPSSVFSISSNEQPMGNPGDDSLDETESIKDSLGHVEVQLNNDSGESQDEFKLTALMTSESSIFEEQTTIMKTYEEETSTDITDGFSGLILSTRFAPSSQLDSEDVEEIQNRFQKILHISTPSPFDSPIGHSISSEESEFRGLLAEQNLDDSMDSSRSAHLDSNLDCQDAKKKLFVSEKGQNVLLDVSNKNCVIKNLGLDEDSTNKGMNVEQNTYSSGFYQESSHGSKTSTNQGALSSYGSTSSWIFIPNEYYAEQSRIMKEYKAEEPIDMSNRRNWAPLSPVFATKKEGFGANSWILKQPRDDVDPCSPMETHAEQPSNLHNDVTITSHYNFDSSSDSPEKVQPSWTLVEDDDYNSQQRIMEAYKLENPLEPYEGFVETPLSPVFAWIVANSGGDLIEQRQPAWTFVAEGQYDEQKAIMKAYELENPWDIADGYADIPLSPVFADRQMDFKEDSDGNPEEPKFSWMTETQEAEKTNSNR